MRAALAFLLVTVGAAALAPGSLAQDDDTKRRELTMVLKVTGVDTRANPTLQFDEFNADGSPFGASEVRTWTKRSERDDDEIHPRFDLKNDVGWIKGSLTIDRSYVETTRRSQTMKYEGEGAIEDGGPARTKYRDAKGVIEGFNGTIKCTSSGKCTGRIRMTGWVRYAERD
ncbi:MAG: hypothetical protein JHC95_04360 [Solirubrobacteraceae bacterium]|nr:hypothetical protein [Solirubrobacteraceae bacterium]